MDNEIVVALIPFAVTAVIFPYGQLLLGKLITVSKVKEIEQGYKDKLNEQDKEIIKLEGERDKYKDAYLDKFRAYETLERVADTQQIILNGHLRGVLEGLNKTGALGGARQVGEGP